MTDFDLRKITGREPPIETDEDMMNALADALGDADALRTERDALRARVAELERELEGSRAIALETQLAQAQTNLDLKKRVAELERSLARRLPPNEPANR